MVRNGLFWRFLIVLTGLFSGTEKVRAFDPLLTKNSALVASKFPEKFPKEIRDCVCYGVSIGMILNSAGILENYMRYVDPKSSMGQILGFLLNRNNPDFRITDNSANPGFYLTPAMVGGIIRLIIEEKIERSKDLSKKIEKLVGKKKNKNLQDFAKAIDLSLVESNFWGDNKDPIYQKNMTLYLLFGFAYKKMGTRKDLKDFLDALCSSSLKEVNFTELNPTSASGWLGESFTLQELATFVFEELKKQGVDFVKASATGVIQNWKLSIIPTLAGYRGVAPSQYPSVVFPDCFETTLHNIVNILAFNGSLWASGGSNEAPYSVDAIKRQLWGLNPVEPVIIPDGIKKFYEKYPGKKLGDGTWIEYSVYDLSNDTMHADWLDMVLKNNIPYAIYTLVLNTKTSTAKPLKVMAICLPSNSTLLDKNKFDATTGLYKNVITLDGEVYDAFVVDGGLVGYELHSLTRNLIIMLNHILGLNLFKDVKDWDSEIQKKDFGAVYISRLAQALFANIGIINTDNIDIIVVKLNKRDEGNEATTEPLAQAGEGDGGEELFEGPEKEFRIRISRGQHGEVLGIKKEGVVSSLEESENASYFIPQLKELSPELAALLLNAYALDLTRVSGPLPLVKDENYLFCGNWALNSDKIDAIEKIGGYLEEHESLSSVKKTFYLSVIQNILNSFNFVEGDWNDYVELVSRTEQFLLGDHVSALFAKRLEGIEKWDKDSSYWETRVLNAFGIKGLFKLSMDFFKKQKELVKQKIVLLQKGSNSVLARVINWGDSEASNEVFEIIKGFPANEKASIFKAALFFPNYGRWDDFEGKMNVLFSAIEGLSPELQKEVFISKNKAGQSPLMVAVSNNNGVLIRKILKIIKIKWPEALPSLFCDQDDVNKMNIMMYALEFLAEYNDFKLLIDTIETFDKKTKNILFQAQSNSGWSLLVYALAFGYIQKIESLIAVAEELDPDVIYTILSAKINNCSLNTECSGKGLNILMVSTQGYRFPGIDGILDLMGEKLDKKQQAAIFSATVTDGKNVAMLGCNALMLAVFNPSIEVNGDGRIGQLVAVITTFDPKDQIAIFTAKNGEGMDAAQLVQKRFKGKLYIDRDLDENVFNHLFELIQKAKKSAEELVKQVA